MPPLHSPDNFYTGYFSKKAQYSYQSAHPTVLTVSEYLKSQGIPEPKSREEWKQFFEKIVPEVKRDLDAKFGNTVWNEIDIFDSEF